MKHLKKFSTQEDYTNGKSALALPYVCLVGESIIYKPTYKPAPDSDSPFYIEAESDIAITFSSACEISENGNDWNALTAGSPTSIAAGNKMYYRAEGLTATPAAGIGSFSSTGGPFNIGGNIMSLLHGDSYKEQSTMQKYAFKKLFYNCIDLTSAQKLALPAIVLSTACYNNMFYGCSSLSEFPALPATTLASGCYSNMFYGCASLRTAPELPATTLESNCYNSMFYYCTSLMTPPKLPATTLADNCYAYLFAFCSALSSAPELPATTLAEGCYAMMFTACKTIITAPELPATTLASNCYGYMFQGCSNLVNAPELPATTLVEDCYNSMFLNCESLVRAPELPALALTTNSSKEGCYQKMFSGCSSLSYIKAMFKTAPGQNYTKEWVNGVASEGTFVKNAAATWNATGVNGIPSGWTVETATE